MMYYEPYASGTLIIYFVGLYYILGAIVNYVSVLVMGCGVTLPDPLLPPSIAKKQWTYINQCNIIVVI